MTDRVDLNAVLDSFDEPWSPRVVAELNGQLVKVAKCDGEFPWHTHEGEDELFQVLRGRMRIELRGRDIELAPGQMFVVPRGVEHRPVAEPGTAVLLFEPASTQQYGDESRHD
ncbi:MAG: cupin domain-containing protein [bacterium]|nr:cupin domain-containing protein [bacterium]